MSQSPGTVAVAKRSLSHFAIGKAFAALVGIGTLLLLVRSLGRGDYGFYIALFAVFEIVQLAASPGAYAVAFRYLPELRQQGAGLALSKLVGGLSLYRLLTLALVAGIAAAVSEPLSGLLGDERRAVAVRWFALILLFEGMARFIDVQFESLLQQGVAQVSTLCRNGSKFIALLWLGQVGSHEVALDTWLQMEAVTSGVGMLVSCVLMERYRRSRRREPQADTVPMPMLGRLARFSAPTYLSQVLYLAAGVDMVKVLVNKLIGTAVIGAFGFASALAGTIQRYLPSFLLIGWVRPLFISARSQGKSPQDLVALAGTVIKLNLLMLAPISTVLLVAGDAVVHLLSGGRMADSLVYLHFFMLLLVLQTVRGVVSLLGMTMEVGNGSLVSTCVSLVGIALGLLFYSTAGVWSLCIGLLIAEGSWTLVMVAFLRRRGLRYGLPMIPICKFGVGVIVAWALGSAVLAVVPGLHLLWQLLIAALAALTCLMACAVLKPFDAEERGLINRLLPGKFFVW
ncbi:MAG: hypothetical protein KBC73_19295 [Burkholderiaceae bacterium]|nr:hypothetical protein [Burkholderiaceae bacterium]